MTRNTMFMARSPLRITFVGGGTDLPEFYRANGHGTCVSAAINKYIYVLVNKKFDSQIRVSYSRTEIVDEVEQVQHPTVREALKLLDIDGGIEIVSISDIPSQGTGLGSSSSFLVSLLKVLHAYKGEYVSAKELSEEAVKIEREILQEPGGKQDQYIAAFGGLKQLRFQADENVTVNPVLLKGETLNQVEESLLMMYTGKTRSSCAIHEKQSVAMQDNLDKYKVMRELAEEFPKYVNSGDIRAMGEAMNRNWEMKQQLADGITNEQISQLYQKGMQAGAYGGKLIGAGGGGFLLFMVPKEKRSSVLKALPDLREEKIGFDFTGSAIIYVGE